MLRPWPAALAVLLILSLPALAVCSSSDNGSSNGNSSPTPFIAPPALSTKDALARLAEIEAAVRTPNRALVGLAQVSDAQVQERSLRILNGESDASGLDDVRKALESGDRIGAGEYLFNVVRHYAQEPVSEADTRQIDTETLDRIDINGNFDPDHQNGMPVSGVYRDAVIKMMELWYGLVGVPEDTPAPS
jgi:hypothetical protein